MQRVIVAVVLLASAFAADAAGARAPRDSPLFGVGRPRPSPSARAAEPPPPRAPSPGPPPCAPPLVADPGYRPLWMPESSCWDGQRVERTPGHWIWQSP